MINRSWSAFLILSEICKNKNDYRLKIGRILSNRPSLASRGAGSPKFVKSGSNIYYIKDNKVNIIFKEKIKK